MKGDFIKFKTSSPSGDLISVLAGIKQMCNSSDAKATIYQRLNMEGISYDGAIHPYEKDNVPVCFNEYTYEMMKPLLESQSYINSFEVYNGEKVDIDIDLIRLERFTNQPKGSLNRWPFYVFPEMTTDLSKPWLEIESNPNQHIIINFTRRHRNNFITYYFLNKYKNRILFVGLEQEYKWFCNQWNLDISYLPVKNFYELAQYINGCSFFAGCQSFCYQLAEALKVPRVLELFPLLPNVIPTGGEAYDFYHQEAVEFYFDKLNKKFYGGN